MQKTYGTLSFYTDEKRNATFWLLTNVLPHVVIRLKHLFPKIPMHAVKKFELPFNNDVAADLKWIFSRYPFSMNSDTQRKLNKMAKTHYKDAHESEVILLPNHKPRERVGLKGDQSLRHYQLVAVELAEKKKKMLLIDEMGLGKTYEGLAMGLIPGRLPLVIVMEPQLQPQWAKKADEFIDLNVHSVKGNKPYTLPEADIYLLKYSQLAAWCDVFSRGWVKGIIFDEVQNLRTGEASAKGAAAASMCQVCDFVIGMTGTLIYNYGIECWNIINIISPNLLGSRYEFLREWCTDGDRGIVKDPHALGSYLREIHFMLRRTREDVGQETKQNSPEIIKVSSDDRLINDMDVLAKQLAMRVISAKGRTEKRDANGEFDRRLRQMTGIAKAKPTAAFVRMLVESGSPTILFGYHHEVYNIWEKELADLKPAWFTGRETPSQKNKSFERFVNGETDVLIMSLHSGAGVDGLQHRCRSVVFGEFDWSPQRHKQCIARVDRDGQLWAVYSHYIMSDFGSDPAMLEVLGLKTEQAHGIQDPNTKKADKQIDPERIQAMARKYLQNKGIDTSAIAPPETNEKIASLL